MNASVARISAQLTRLRKLKKPLLQVESKAFRSLNQLERNPLSVYRSQEQVLRQHLISKQQRVLQQ